MTEELNLDQVVAQSVNAALEARDTKEAERLEKETAEQAKIDEAVKAAQEESAEKLQKLEEDLAKQKAEHDVEIEALSQPKAPLGGTSVRLPGSNIRVASKYDKFGVFDLALRYELIKAGGARPDVKMWRALVERGSKMARSQDKVGMENGEPVYESSIDWSALSPTDLEISEVEDEKLFGVKADRQMQATLAMDPVTKRGVQQLHRIAVKGDEVMHSDYSGYGDQWVPTLMNAALWRTIRLNTVVLPQIAQFDMPSNPYLYPKESTDPTFYLLAETEDLSQLVPTGYIDIDSKMGTAVATFTASKMGGISFWSEELEEDAIVAIEPAFRDQYGVAMAHDIDKILLSGDLTTANTNVFDNGSANTTASNLVLDGFRHEALITTTADGRDGGALTIDDFGATRALMGTAGKLGIRASDLLLFSDPAVWHKAMLLGEVLTVDKFGPLATVVSGQLASVFDVPYLVSEDYGLTDSSGMIHHTTGNNTVGSFFFVNKRSPKIGWRRRPRIRVIPIPLSEAVAIMATARLDMQFFQAGCVGLSYNLTV